MAGESCSISSTARPRDPATARPLERPELLPPRLLLDGCLRDGRHSPDLLRALIDDDEADLLPRANRSRYVSRHELDVDRALLAALHQSFHIRGSNGSDRVCLSV